MPLQSGSTRDIISNNISEMVDSGHPQKQAVAAALHKAYGPKLKRPTLHPEHPFNSKKAPDNRKRGVPALPAPQTMSTRDVVKGAIIPGGRLPVISGGEFDK